MIRSDYHHSLTASYIKYELYKHKFDLCQIYTLSSIKILPLTTPLAGQHQSKL